MDSSDGEDNDYMSDNFVIPSEAEDIRPGLILDRNRRREIEIIKKKQLDDDANRKKFVSPHLLAKEKMIKGLQQPIKSDNKGFQMLQKMGFTPGSGIGGIVKGRTEPISIEIKNDRKGLGRDQALKEIELKKRQYRESFSLGTNINDFRSAMSRKRKEKEYETDLFKSAKACHELDITNNIEIPKEKWFWPNHCLPETDEEEEEDDDDIEIEYDVQTKLETITLYLRGTYNYCVWCGVQFDDEKDLSTSCPGMAREDH